MNTLREQWNAKHRFRPVDPVPCCGTCARGFFIDGEYVCAHPTLNEAAEKAAKRRESIDRRVSDSDVCDLYAGDGA
jgi:hypothetical protein